MTILVQQQLREATERLIAEGDNCWPATVERFTELANPTAVLALLDEIERLERERDRLKVDVDALLCDCPDYADVERLCHVLSYLGYSTPTGGEASARWLSLVKELIGAVETSELLRRDKEAVAEYRQLKAENERLNTLVIEREAVRIGRSLQRHDDQKQIDELVALGIQQDKDEIARLKAENAELRRGQHVTQAIATMPADQVRETYNLAYYAPREIGSDAEQIRAGMIAVLRKAMTKEQP